MKSLSERQKHEKADLVALLQEAKQLIEKSIKHANDVCQVAMEQVDTNIKKYNCLLAKARVFQEKILAQQNEFIDSQLDDWHGSGESLAYETWKDQWSWIAFDDVELDLPPVELELDKTLNDAEELAGTDDDLYGDI